MEKFSHKRAEMIFALSLITSFIGIICIVIAFFLEINELIQLYIPCLIILIFNAYLAKKGKLKVSRLIYFIIINTLITVTASYIGIDGGVEIMFMFTLAAPFLVFSFKRGKRYLVFFPIASITLWILLYITDFNLVTTDKLAIDIANSLIYPIVIITTLSLTMYLLMHYSYLNFKNLSSIHDNREDALEASNAKSLFLSTMSHEIRTPLNAIIGLSHILRDNKPEKNQTENLDALNYSGKTLLSLLNNVLDFSKMQSTEIELDKIPTDLYSAVKQIKKIHAKYCLQNGITMNLEIDKNIPIVWLDIVRFNQVINNLISNALKFTHEGSVSLGIKKQNETEKDINLLVEIIDTGIGISKDKQETIWEPFSQASNTTNRLYGGTGLGLPIVKNILQSMNSKVYLTSIEGSGSRFYFNINLKKSSENIIQKQVIKKEFNLDNKKILLVEDNLINVMVGKQILEKNKLIVSVANDGLTAVNMLKQNNFDIVLMDLQMPIMNGYEATIEIRKFNTEIPILALSAAVFMEVKEKIKETGMNGFILKPFDPSDLLNQIDEAINK